MPCVSFPVFSRSLHNDASSRVVYSLARDADQKDKEAEKPVWTKSADEAHRKLDDLLSKFTGNPVLLKSQEAGEAILSNDTEDFSEERHPALEGLGHKDLRAEHDLTSLAWTESGQPGKVVVEPAEEL